MLSLMRKKAGSWMIKVLLGIIVIVFVFWGVGSFRDKQASEIASVNDIPISFDEYRKVYDSLIDRFQKNFGNNLTDELIKTFQIKRQAIDQIVQEKLLLAEASRLNIRITDGELAGLIRNFPAFQRNGEFNNRLYNNILSQNRLSPESFEKSQRNSMRLQKLRGLISDGVKVSQQEVREWYDWENTTVNIEYVVMEPERYKDIEADADEVKAYFEKNKASYKTQPQIKVGYLRFVSKNYTDDVSLTDEEIQNYYESNPEDFETPKTVEARHILIRVAQDADAETAAAAKQKAQDIFNLTAEGHEFEALAKEYSEGPSKDQGGKLGAFKREDMVAPFSEKAFSMEPGEISEPVRTQFGWHLIKVEKINAASALSLPEAIPDIRRKLMDDRTKTLAYDAADALYEEVFDGEDLSKVAESRKLTLHETDYFTRKDPLKGIPDSRKFITAAFGLVDLEISEVQDLMDGYYILQVMDKKPEVIPDLTDVEEKVRNDLIKEKQEVKADEAAKSFLSELAKGTAMEEVGKKFDVIPTSTGYFKRNDPIPEIGNEQEIAETAFTLSSGKNIAKEAVRGTKGYYIIRLIERKQPESGGFDAEKNAIEKRLIQKKQIKAFETYVADLKDDSNVWIMDGFLD